MRWLGEGLPSASVSYYVIAKIKMDFVQLFSDADLLHSLSRVVPVSRIAAGEETLIEEQPFHDCAGGRRVQQKVKRAPQTPPLPSLYLSLRRLNWIPE